MKVTRAELSDIPAIIALENECFSTPYSASTVMSSLENPMNFVAVAKEDGVITGYAEFGNFVDAVFVDRVAVFSSHRRKGIASTLLIAGEEWAKDLGIDALMLEVRSKNSEAIALYEKHGFEKIGKRARYYKEPPDDAHIYRKQLLK